MPEGKTAKNRVHLDVNVAAGRATAGARCVRPGACDRSSTSSARRSCQVFEGEEGPDSFWIVMADPEGNEFCLQ